MLLLKRLMLSLKDSKYLSILKIQNAFKFLKSPWNISLSHDRVAPSHCKFENYNALQQNLFGSVNTYAAYLTDGSPMEWFKYSVHQPALKPWLGWKIVLTLPKLNLLLNNGVYGKKTKCNF